MTESSDVANTSQTKPESTAIAALSPSGGNGEEGDPAQQLTFLYKALDDNQNLIKFLDAKAAFAVALLSAMIGKVLANFGGYFPWNEQSHWRQLLVVGFGLSTIVAVILVSLIVFPTINPTLNTNLLPHCGPLFFITQLDPKKWRRIFSRSPRYSRLVLGHSEYFSQIAAADNGSLLRIVSGEVLKVSYIRQIKADRVKALAVPLIFCSILFCILMVSDATGSRSIKPTLIHLDGPLKLDGPITLSPPPEVIQPPHRKEKVNKSTNRSRE